jgi:hypothetical protein
MASNAPGPDKCAMTVETSDHMHKMLSGLSPRVRAILKAAFLEEQDRDEICVKFGINRNHLRLLICRAKKTLSVCAHKPMTDKRGLHLRRSSRPKRSAATQVMSPRPVGLVSATSRPATIFLPPLHATDVQVTAGLG